MTVKDKKFRSWTGRKEHHLGWKPEEWQRYFDIEEIEAFREGFETAEMRKDRERFWSYAKNERNRLARKAVRDEKASRPPETYVARTTPVNAYLQAPRRVRIACARYWFYAHILPRGEGKPALTPRTAGRVLGLNEEDQAQIFYPPPQSECQAAAADALQGEYPRFGILWQQAERMKAPADRQWGLDKSPEPPVVIGKLIDPVHHSLGLSEWFYRNKKGQRALYGWDISNYVSGEAKEQQEIEAVVEAPEDYRTQLLSIFD